MPNFNITFRGFVFYMITEILNLLQYLSLPFIALIFWSYLKLQKLRPENLKPLCKELPVEYSLQLKN